MKHHHGIRVLLPKNPASRPYKTFMHFIQGLKRHGVNVEPTDRTQEATCDLQVVWGYKAPKIINLQKQHGYRVLVLELGYFGDRREYWTSAGYDGLNGRADFLNKGKPGDRWAKTGITVKPWKRRKDGYVLLTGQVFGDASVKSISNMDVFYALTTRDLHMAGHDVVFRPHPRNWRPNMQPVGSRVSTGTLEEDLAGAKWVVTFNSNSAVDAILNGVPAVVLDEGSMAWPVAGHSVSEKPPKPNRTRWLNELAYACWTPSELSSGEAWDHLKDGMWLP